jgi:geranylgeranyl diphosphate synthase type II
MHVDSNPHSILDSKLFDQHMQDFLIQTLEQDDCPSNLKDSIVYSVCAPGKRLRPRLFCAVAKALGISYQAILPAAVGIECIHTFTLIHDDMPCMDNSDLRRGKLSNHKQFSESIALLAGDGLFALGIEMFLRCEVDAAQLLEGLRFLLKQVGVQGVVGGQAQEELLMQSPSLEGLLAVHRKKTGALFRASIEIPAIFAGARGEVRSLIDELAQTVGFVFQIVDDLEDLEVSPKSILMYWEDATILAHCEERLRRVKEKMAQPEFGLTSLLSLVDELEQKLDTARQGSLGSQ